MLKKASFLKDVYFCFILFCWCGAICSVTEAHPQSLKYISLFEAVGRRQILAVSAIESFFAFISICNVISYKSLKEYLGSIPNK